MKQWKVYVDGSFNYKSMYYGGAYIATNDSSDYKYRNSFSANKEEWVQSKKVSGEIGAILLFFTDMYTQGQLESGDNVTIYHDYSGLSFWATGAWQTKKPASIKYKNYIDKVISNGVTIDFVKVKAHSGNEFNEIVDSMAKLAVGIN